MLEEVEHTLRFERRRVIAAAVFLCLASTGPTAVRAESMKLNLEEALNKAVESSHLVRAANYGREKAEVGVKRARAEKYLPEAEFNLQTGFVPEARGTAMESADEADELQGLGPFYKINLNFIQPLYTFGRLKYLEQAAREGLEAAEAKSRLTLEELSLLVIRTYWALSSSRRALTLAEELRDNFRELVSEVKTRLDDEDSEVDDGDLLEVKSSTFGIEKTYLDARENLQRSSLALRTLIGDGEEREILTEDEPAPGLGLGVEEFHAHLVEKGVSSRQIDLAAAASRALEAKIKLMESDRYPVVFMAAGAGLARASNREDQTNPFVVDDFNYDRIGAEIGLKWKPNIYKKSLEVKELEKEHGALVENIEALRQKLTVETLDTFGEAAKNRALLEAARLSLKASKSWLRLSLDNWEMGLGEVSRLIDAYEAYYRMKGVEIEMELEYNLSLARVAAALGDVNQYLAWVKNGKVIF